MKTRPQTGQTGHPVGEKRLIYLLHFMLIQDFMSTLTQATVLKAPSALDARYRPSIRSSTCVRDILLLLLLRQGGSTEDTKDRHGV